MDKKIYQPLSVCGNATSGKDSLYFCLESILKEYGIETYQFSIASNLKIDLNEFTTKHYGISSYTKDIKEKTLIRDLMVCHGGIKRQQSQGKHWTSQITPNLLRLQSEGYLCIVTDVRFDEFPEDEIYWAKNVLKGKLIHVSRVLPNGKLVSPPNDSEARNEKSLIEKSDYHVKWPTTDSFNYRCDLVKIQLKPLLEQITKNNE